MSGQYPPPNPAHPFSRVPVPSQRVIPPWGHSPQPAPGLNMVGSSMNYFGSPHIGLRGTQPWAVPPQSHPKPTETRPLSANPLFGLQMLMSSDNTTRIPSEYQQEESMDLSSHTNVTKPSNVHPEETSDVLRNGTILNVNGEVNRTETSDKEKESVVTSVIATNPLRDSEVGELVIPEAGPTQDADYPGTVSEAVSGFSSVLKTTSSITPTMKNTSVIDSVVSKDDMKADTDSEVDKIRDFIMKVDKPPEHLELSENYGFDRITGSKDVDSLGTSQKLDESNVSFFESSALSVDTDESKLVVAESSAEDIFGISPMGNLETSVLEDYQKSKDSKEILSIADTFPQTSIPEKAPVPPVLDDKNSVNPVAVANSPEPQPSVENVEILLESMFNSQEETSCSSQTSSGVPQSVIVSSTGKVTGERIKISSDIVSPMKVEDLASTLAEDTPVKSEVKEQKKNEQITDDVMQEIEKKLEMLTESVSLNEMPNQTNIKSEAEKELQENESTEIILESKEAETQHEMKTEPSELPPPIASERSDLSAKPGSSSNPFIEVENELEKMFAGIVEPVEGENQSQNLVSETKKPDAGKRTAVKRKKTNNRRPSDSSVFGGGSSGESTPVKKRGRKRISDMDRGAKKIKLDNGEPLKKKKLPKDINSDMGGKVKGPFVHIEGPKDSPSSVVVVNGGVRLDDEDVQKDKASARRKHSSVHRAEGVASRKAYSSSTLSARYNSESADLTWVCALCHRGPHCEGGLGGEPAGDLFGPYRVPATPPVDDVTPPGVPSDRDVVEEQKRRGGKYPKSLRTSGGADSFIHKMGKKSKRSQSMESIEGPGLLPVEGSLEVWLHSACAEWAPGLYVVGTSLVGLDDAVWTAIRTRCCCCGETGAGIGCVVRNCPARAHYPCALVAGWLLDQDTFIARCHTHRTVNILLNMCFASTESDNTYKGLTTVIFVIASNLGIKNLPSYHMEVLTGNS